MARLDRVARLTSSPRFLPVYELAWILVGFVVALFATRLTSKSRRAMSSTQSPQAAEPKRAAEPVAPTEFPRETTEAASDPAPATASLQTVISHEAQHMALSMASELANLVSAVEGRAHHLIEAAPTRTQLPSAAEAMLTSIARLRGLHTKLVAFGRGRPVLPGATDVNELITSLSGELLQMQLGLELRWDPPEYLPQIKACPAALRDALLFLCSALLQVERGATRLTFTVERSFASDEPAIVIELQLEWWNAADSRKHDSMSDPAFALDLEAAKQLIESHHGTLELSHSPGNSVHAVVVLPVVIPAEFATAEPAVPSPQSDQDHQAATPHRFGGALVLESDPALRAVLARELKASGRAVFACADGASAHTFLQATPDRFELLIVDDIEQLHEHTPLARTIRQHTPDLKICLLSPTPATSPAAWPNVYCLQKPFGVHELRRTLASILTVG